MSTKRHTRAEVALEARTWRGPSRWVAVTTAGVLGLFGALNLGHRPGPFQHKTLPALATVEVDRGDVSLVVTENGFLESSVDDVVRCRVESILGLPAAAPPSGGEARSSQPRKATAGAGSLASRSRETPLASVTKALAGAKSKLAGLPGAAKSAASGPGLDSKLQRNALAQGSSAVTSSNSASMLDSSAAQNRSGIRSFEYTVEPHIPLRSSLPDQGVMPTPAPAPLTIISILPEGSRVKAGDVVCELDSSALREALTVQQLRYVRAKAWVEQATYSLEADRIALREYELGVLPQDVELVRQRISICQTEREQAVRNLAWAQGARAKGFRTAAAVNADAAIVEQTEIAFRDAQTMLEQLVKYTGKRIIKARRARIQAIRADLLSLELTFRLERERLKRIETMIANCTMRAPRDGIIVHANPPYGSANVEKLIREGAIVHASQAVFRLIDPSHIQVRAEINESRVARIRPGQPVLIHLEAFPDRPLRGSVAEIIPIPSLVSALGSDVRTFFATVRIESGGFDLLTTGLTAELEFMVETRRRVTRVPLEAIRWINDQAFAATMTSTPIGPDWQWRPVALGLSNTAYAEVVTGLEPGDRVIAHSESLAITDLGFPDAEPAFDLALQRTPSSR
jgi:HlyD family secretion protein